MSIRSEFNENRRGWIVFISVVFITITRAGFYYSFGIIVAKLTEEFNESVALTSWVGIGAIAITNTFSFVPTLVIRRLGRCGYRVCGIVGTVLEGIGLFSTSCMQKVPHMFFTYTILFGVGSCFVNMASNLIVTAFFPRGHKRHVFATTSVYCGYAIASLIYNPLTNTVVEGLSWRVAFQAQATLVILVGVAGSWTFVPNNEDKESKPLNADQHFNHTTDVETSTKQQQHYRHHQEQQQQHQQQPHENLQQDESNSMKSNARAFLKLDVVCWLVAAYFNAISYFTPFFILPHYMKKKNLTTFNISLIMMMLSLSECLIYLVTSLPGDLLAGKLIYVHITASSLLCLLNYLWSLLDANYGMILALAMSEGLLIALNCVYVYACSAEVTDINIEIAWSVTNIFSGFGVITAPLFSGFIYDLTLSYYGVFFMMSSVTLVSSILYCSIPLIKSCGNNNNNKNNKNMDNNNNSNYGYHDINNDSTDNDYYNNNDAVSEKRRRWLCWL
ncbi:hypothetical protein HELRODRAFT_185490 [Helobdella robusta]|uniref:Major facilitator superfamily (MFS) profile domain-containing protein n=1 Tax=Helobdella robusta TaxID=6412 RepID=T1FMW0_HELRO|nr:hypothetical protein HELRODRAFT_185490 [Helobdella robusta]ESO07038.1 hypothetical protein HELRODRAFT_185490 [Helobdella robusta]